MGFETRFTDADRRELAARGIPEAEALRQLELLARPPARVRLERPCTVGDGIAPLGESRLPELLAAHAEAARSGAVSEFVPASGAATRMFREPLAALATAGPLDPDAVREAAARGEEWARGTVALVDGLPRLAFAGSLAGTLAARGLDLAGLRERGPWRTLLEALLGPGGLDYARLPKGLLEFHRAPGGGARTAFEEHLEEAAELARDGAGRCSAHFTVAPEHRGRFEALLAARAPAFARERGITLEAGFSEQHPGTDTLAADPAGGPFRGADGRLLFRPSGHGALLRNLAATGGDLVFVKNVDNVAAARLRPETLRWGRALVGLAALLRGRVAAHVAALAAGEAGAGERARAFALATFGRDDAPPAPGDLAAWLERPLRVCGMVRNTGEPGGGPFWVRGADGRVTPQVVESAQVDAGDPAQAAVFARATHFNPVFFACALRDGAGRPHDLEARVDPAAVIVTRKSAGGRELLALERPGLWNGAMAGWNSVFVEVPLEVFNPVKTVLDLLRPEHQG